MTDRLAKLQQICDYWGVKTSGPIDTTADEDIRPYIEGEIPIGRYVAVTQHDDIYYIYPVDTLELAQHKASSYVTDSIHYEIPVAIIDLDFGDAWEPEVDIRWQPSINSTWFELNGAT